jgi:uncharacterized paraquat-inducible protein A
MSLPFTPPRSAIPSVGLAYRVSKVTVIVEIECLQCEAHAVVTLINGQSATCPRCGATYDCGGLRWDATTSADAPPQVAIAAGAPTRRAN